MKLLPCPFCGGEAYLTKNYGDWYVGCNCKAEPCVEDHKKDDAIKVWNTRPDNQSSDEDLLNRRHDDSGHPTFLRRQSD